MVTVPPAPSVLNQREDPVWSEPVGASQLFELHDDHALQNVSLQLLQQLAGGMERPCNTQLRLFSTFWSTRLIHEKFKINKRRWMLTHFNNVTSAGVELDKRLYVDPLRSLRQ